MAAYTHTVSQRGKRERERERERERPLEHMSSRPTTPCISEKLYLLRAMYYALTLVISSLEIPNLYWDSLQVRGGSILSSRINWNRMCNVSIDIYMRILHADILHVSCIMMLHYVILLDIMLHTMYIIDINITSLRYVSHTERVH